MKALQVALNLGMASDLVIHTPLMWLDKAATWRLVDTLGRTDLIEVIRGDTHTCYLGERGAMHDWGYGCGQCPACELRRAGWENFANTSDALSNKD